MHPISTSLVAIALVISACSTSSPATTAIPTQPGEPIVTDRQPSGDVVTVSRVLDGDSFEATLDGSTVEVRLVNLNAPERDECHGDTARDALAQLIDGADLVLEGVGDPSTDRFGRLLRIAYKGDVNVNATMVFEGNAISLGTDLASYATEAWEARRGLWAPDACGAAPGPLVITDFEFDPPGPDDRNAENEWVDIENTGDVAVDVSGWILRDESTQHRFTFPDGAALPPGERYRVRSGCGSDRGRDLYWCANDPVWSNSGDTIILQDPAGNVADRVLYAG